MASQVGQHSIEKGNEINRLYTTSRSFSSVSVCKQQSKISNRFQQLVVIGRLTPWRIDRFSIVSSCTSNCRKAISLTHCRGYAKPVVQSSFITTHFYLAKPDEQKKNLFDTSVRMIYNGKKYFSAFFKISLHDPNRNTCTRLTYILIWEIRDWNYSSFEEKKA